jgi:hypothetical protein
MGATSLFEDGQVLTVNGNTGTIRIGRRPGEPAAIPGEHTTIERRWFPCLSGAAGAGPPGAAWRRQPSWIVSGEAHLLLLRSSASQRSG